MRLALITATLGNGAFIVIAPPGSPRERSDAFKALVVAEDRHPAIAEIQLWGSGTGIEKRKRFDFDPSAEIEKELTNEEIDALVAANQELDRLLTAARAEIEQLKAALSGVGAPNTTTPGTPVPAAAAAAAAPATDAPPAQPAATAPAPETSGAGQAAPGMEARKRPK